LVKTTNFEFVKTLWQQYRPVWQFLLIFFGVYSVLSSTYFFYLNQATSMGQIVDPLTAFVGRWVHWIFGLIGVNASVAPWDGGGGLVISIGGKAIAQLVEGCNAVSLMILFISFILATARGFLKTFGFLMAGLVIIFTVNLARIVLISLAIFQWASLTNMLHDLVFPAIIYGTVLVLWLSWVMAIKSKKVAE
jgi:exosortase family protein XrtF